MNNNNKMNKNVTPENKRTLHQWQMCQKYGPPMETPKSPLVKRHPMVTRSKARQEKSNQAMIKWMKNWAETCPIEELNEMIETYEPHVASEILHI